MGLLSRVQNSLDRRTPVDRGTLKVSRNSWHGRLYHFWRENSEFKNHDGYRENLCHYVRVVVFWAPLAVFLRWHPKRVSEWITPATVTVALAALAGIIYAVVVNPGGVLAAFLITLGGCLLAAAIIFAIIKIDDNKYEIRQWWRTGGRGVKTIKRAGAVVSYPFVLLYRLGVAIGRPIGRLLAWEPFWNTRFRSDLPFGAILVMLVLVTLIVLGVIFISPWIILWVALAGGGVSLILAGVVVWMDYIKPWLKDRRYERTVNAPKRDENILKVGARFAVAKKGKICPFIEVQ